MFTNPRMYILVFALVAITACSAGRLALLPQECTPGDRTSDYCNSCLCIADGSGYQCTTNECPQGDYDLNPKSQGDESCVLGNTKRVACNTCNCEGNPPKWACTKFGCI